MTYIKPALSNMIRLERAGLILRGICFYFFFLKSLPSYLQIASIHSSVRGMDSCLSRSKVTMIDLQIHFISFVFVSITRWSRWKLFVPTSETAVCTAIWSDAKICLTKSASIWTSPSRLRDIRKRSIQSCPNRKKKNKQCCWRDRIYLRHWSATE